MGESAALLFTAGFAHSLSGFFSGLAGSGATLTVALYFYAKEQGEFEVAFAIAAILMIMALLIIFPQALFPKHSKIRTNRKARGREALEKYLPQSFVKTAGLPVKQLLKRIFKAQKGD